MGDAAHVGSHQHKVFEAPLKVTTKVESWDRPDNYKRRQLANEPDVPDKIEVWRVQKSGKTFGGVVSRRYGFEDSPDAEIIAAGFNDGKEYGAVGIGRHGNFLQWGFSGAPSIMTEAGKRLFINCICYIKAFDGKGALVRRQGSHRDNALRLAALITQIKDKSFFSNTFSEQLQEKYKDDPEGLVKYYLDDYEFIYREDVFRIDRELKSLGIESNREVESLQKLISLLEDGNKAQMAKKLLGRYTSENFERGKQWQEWFDASKERLFFSDVGGYKFFVAPEGYLDK